MDAFISCGTESSVWQLPSHCVRRLHNTIKGILNMMNIVFFLVRGLCLAILFIYTSTVNGMYYAICDNVQPNLHQKQMELLEHSIIFLQDKAVPPPPPPHHHHHHMQKLAVGLGLGYVGTPFLFTGPIPM